MTLLTMNLSLDNVALFVSANGSDNFSISKIIAFACVANSNNDCENFLQSIRLGKRDKYGSPLFRNLDAFIRTIFKSLLKEK